MTIELTLLPRVACRGQEVTAPRLRALLALLAGDLRAGSGTERLVRGLWPDGGLPERPGKALQVLVSRARAQWGADLLVSTPTGYRLGLTEEQVDSSALLLHAAASAERAGAGDHAAALAAAEAGLALWETGHAVGDSRDPVAALRTARAPVRDTLVRTRALALARLGRHPEAVGPLAEAAARRPRDEEVLAELLRGEAATTGPPAALARYETYRRTLRETLGTEPGAQLRAVQKELLLADQPVARYGVPHEPNPLLGRDEDITAVERLGERARVVTVVGPGGLGKTRLAHAVSRRAAQPVVHVVPLVAVTADADVATAVATSVASALGAGDGVRKRQGPGHPVPAILAALGPGPALLVLDNCEQVVEGVADLVHALVSAAKDLRVLATSRAPLGLTSEALYALPELGLDTCVELFGQRARAARPGVELPPDEVAALCRHLDGLPLAVELAAARAKALSVREIAHRLEDRFALLRGSARDAPERHRTLHAVVEWSWNLLPEEARAAMRMLSVFPGGFTGEAAQAVLGEDPLHLLEQLAGQSLLTVADTPAGVRFRMLEAVREFSTARCVEAGGDEEALGRFLRWARDFGVAHHDVLFGADVLASWDRVRAEQDNLVPALRHALAHDDGPAVAALTAVLAALWATDANYPRLAALGAETGPPLSHYRPDPEHVEVARAAAVLCTAGLFMGFGAQLVRHLVTLRRLPPAPPDTLLRAVAVVLSAVPDSRPPGHEVLNALCADPNPLVAGVAECVATYVWEYAYDTDRAMASVHRAITALAPVDNPPLQLMCHSRRSELCLQVGEGEAAYAHLRAALGVLPGLGNAYDYIGVRQGLALACLQRGEADEAEYWLGRADAGPVAQQDAFYSPEVGGRAEIALARGCTEEGLRLWRRAVGRLAETAAGGASAAGALVSGDAASGSLYPGGDHWLDPWALQVQSAAVTAHAYAGRTGEVAEVRDRVRRQLRALLGDLSRSPLEMRMCGTMLHALGVADLASGCALASDGALASEDALASGDALALRAVRMIALAERLRVLREFQPTMSAERARRAAGDADGAAYADAVSEYAALGRDELVAAARELVSVRPQG
ncbi:AfsR/SARP family transcriptional regulator [Streptomyces sp. NBC_00237]|uniref:ATP-binding protein n=1 Tax=Streptomyces sp. NBC_00237 TaxID=2975687 RepID=UPI00224DBF73|nr:BTAD domain-containing putative transcriptional regulator [Streptomyces sp. NBC_00237]MCX5205265.1 AfsR/SARP family transcriptional regulator [Streptomyces sp. NBC_00237]